MYLCAKCRLSVSYVYTVHSSNNKVGGDKKKGEEKTKRKEFWFVLAPDVLPCLTKNDSIFLLSVFFLPQC